MRNISYDITMVHYGTYQAFEMLHEHLQADIVGEDSLSGAALGRAIHARGHVRR